MTRIEYIESGHQALRIASYLLPIAIALFIGWRAGCTLMEIDPEYAPFILFMVIGFLVGGGYLAIGMICLYNASLGVAP